MRSLWDSPGRTNLDFDQGCRVRTARAANPLAEGASLMARRKKKNRLFPD
jgi:hypothetical protein